MSSDLPSPPRLAERLLAAALPDSECRESIIGDLREEYCARATGADSLRLQVWYWCEALRLGARFAVRRLCTNRQPHTARFTRGDGKRETLMSGLASDVKYALRAIRKQPGVSLIVAVTLALGLGVNATVLGMMDAMLLRPFQFRDYPRLVVLWGTTRGGLEREQVSAADFRDWRARAHTVEHLAAWAWLDATLTGDGEPERVQGFRVSPGFFELLGIRPALGRTFTIDEEQPGNHRRAVIGDGLWKRRFGANPAVVGTGLIVDGEVFTIVGIAPPAFAFPVGSELWVPLAFTPAQATDRETRPLTVAGKLATGGSLAAAQAEMETIGLNLSNAYPATNADRGISVRPLSTAFREGSTVPFVGILQGAAILVLLVACANIAGLLLARAIDRQRELALRTALGAGRSRIVRQLVIETIVLGILASIPAILLAKFGLDALRVSIPAETARFVEGWDNLRLDLRLAAAIPALAIGVGLIIGLIPAMAATRADMTDALREGDRGSVGGIRGQRARRALVVAEIALALALLIAASLTLAGGMRLATQPGGFESKGLLTLQIPLPDSKYRAPDSRREFAAAAIAQIEAIPSVQRVTLANVLPASGWSPVQSFVVDYDPAPDPSHRPRAGYRAVSADYFDALRVPIMRGRAFSTFDRKDSQPVAIISTSVAERFWPAQDPVGRRVRFEGPDSEWLHIVGVVGDVKMYNWWDGEDLAAVYVPLSQAPPAGLAYVAIRVQGDPRSVTPSVREAVKSVDRFLPLSNVRTMGEAIAESSAGLTHLALLMGVCGGIGMLLSIVGIYGVMSYIVSQRMHEFGVRMALGATARDVFRLTLREAGTVTGLGLVIGFALAFVLARLLASALFGLVSLQAMTFLGVGFSLAIVSLGAACLPARRALTVDPALVLRGQ